MRNQSSLFLTAAILFFSFATSAKADAYISCGENNDAGPAKAEISLVDRDSSMIFFLKGKEAPEDSYAVKPVEGHWIVTVFNKQDEAVKKYLFNLNGHSVEVFSIKNDKEKKISEHSCVSRDN